MDMEEFKEKYEELKNNPMYQKYCSVLEIKDKVIKKLQQENEELKIQLLEKKCSDKDIEYLDVLNKYVNLVKTDEDIRLDQTKKVFDAICYILKEGSCTYRYLIYDLLGFKTENYIDLIKGLEITNAIVELEELRKLKGEK